MNTLFGSHEDRDSKIIPVKINRGDQIYDTKYKTLIQPKLFSMNEGDSAYWKDFDWLKAADAGMKRVGLPFSGEYDFVETEMYWPINHMVAPKEQAIGCAECHTRDGGRLENLAGFYLPGRDQIKGLDTSGIILILLALGGVIFHSAIRIMLSAKS